MIGALKYHIPNADAAVTWMIFEQFLFKGLK